MSASTPPTDRAVRRVTAHTTAWLALDVLAVLIFATVGRRNHEEGLGLLGVLAVAAPFVVGGLVGAALSRSWRAPLSWRSGLATWGGAVLVGLALRALVLDRLPLSFAIVATVALAVLLLCWRAVARLLVRR